MVKIIEKEDNFSKILITINLIFVVLITSHTIYMTVDTAVLEKFMQNYSTIFMSIILEAMPFIMLGALMSAVIQVYVSEEFITRILPKNRLLGIFIASIIGIIFPICECAVIPIVRKLIKKGVPTSIAVTFMLAVPLVNPVSLISTYYAFYSKPDIVIARAAFGLLCAMMIGYLMGIIEKDSSVINDSSIYIDNQCNCGCGNSLGYYNNKSRLVSVINHTSIELYNIGKYLIFGALLSSAFQVFISKSILVSMGKHYVISILVMMVLAYVLSICSAADAFIAKTFLGQFTSGSIIAFLILGPMVDIKNTLMLFGNFKRKFVIELIAYIFFFAFIVGCLVNFMAMFEAI